MADVNFVMSKISDPFLRVADRLMTLKGLDEVMNGDGDTKVRDYSVMRAHQPHALVIARLAGNPNFEKLAIDLKNAGNPMGNAPIMDEGWPKLVDYLCNHVAPLV
ncbi:hypothetical protein [Fluviicoccus keumensis]|nr:hypothetical protein [Fluviicoccus keumensis]